MKKFPAISLVSLFAILLSLPLDANAAVRTFSSFSEAVGYVVKILNRVVPLIVGLAILFFIWTVFKYVKAAGDEAARKKGQLFVMYGILGIFIMLSVWGLLGILINSFWGGQLDTSGDLLQGLEGIKGSSSSFF